MQINFSETAKKKVKEAITKYSNRKIKLFYDIEGCGCSTDGIPTLKLEKEIYSAEIEIRTNGLPLFIHEADMVFWDQKMTIDYSETNHCYILKSPSQMLNSRMRLIV